MSVARSNDGRLAVHMHLIEERAVRWMQGNGASPEEVQAWRAKFRDALDMIAGALPAIGEAAS